MSIYNTIAHLLIQIDNCKKSGNTLCEARAMFNLERLVNRLGYTSMVMDFKLVSTVEHLSKKQKLAFTFTFMHMDENGYRDGYTYHLLTVKPCLMFGVSLSINGRDRRGFKEYLYEAFQSANSEKPHFDEFRICKGCSRFVLDQESEIVNGSTVLSCKHCEQKDTK